MPSDHRKGERMTIRPLSRQPIPGSAVLAFRGSLFDVFQWSQQLYDGSFAIFEKVRRPDTVYILPVVDGAYVISSEEQPGLVSAIGLIGGRVRDDESIDDAARRELAEGAGLAAGRMTLWRATHPLVKIEWCVYIFVAFDCEAIPRPIDAGERITTQQVDFESLVALAASEQFGDSVVALELLRAAAKPGERRRLENWLVE